MARDNFLADIQVYRNSPAYRAFLNSPLLDSAISEEAIELVHRYRMRVGKKTGRLSASADASLRLGGHNHDRIIGVVTVGGESTVTTWTGHSSLGEYDPVKKRTKRVRRSSQSYGTHTFNYGEYHEEGTRRKGRGYRKNSQAGYHELREVANEMRGTTWSGRP